MNKKVSVVIVVLVFVAVCTLAILYAPGIMEAMLRIHQIPQH